MEGEKVRRNLFQHTKPRWKPRRRWGRGRAFRPSCGRRTCRSKGTASPSPSPWASLKPSVQSRSDVPVYPKTHNFQNEFQYPMEQTFMPLLSFLTPIPNCTLTNPTLSHPQLQQWEKQTMINNKTKFDFFLGIRDPQNNRIKNQLKLALPEKSTEIRLYYTENKISLLWI